MAVETERTTRFITLLFTIQWKCGFYAFTNITGKECSRISLLQRFSFSRCKLAHEKGYLTPRTVASARRVNSDLS